MKNILLSLIFSLALGATFAQNKSELKGVLIDSLDQKPMELVTVSITNFKDSAFVSYASTSKTGEFSFKHLPSNKPIVVIASSLGFSDYVKVLTLKEGEALDLGAIKMKMRNIELGDVIVKSERQAIVINNDTITFNVEAFKVRPNAVVEELLKKLPGVQVDNDGTITVNGKSVSKITIDGKEFFGNDPKIASQNLNADLLDKIQIFDDRENDPDHLIEDANVSKIINLKFKKAFKKSVFGKVYVGGGTRDRYETGGLINMFRDTLQVSLIGVGNNLNKTGFSSTDLSKMGGFDRSGTGALNDGTVSVGGRGYGIENVMSGGVNINNDYGKKLKMNLLYYYSNSDVNSSYRYNNQQYLNSDTLNSSSENNGIRNSYRHTISGLVQWKPTEKYNIRYEPKIAFNTDNSLDDGNNESSNLAGALTSSKNNSVSDNKEISFKHNFTFYKALKKKGASLNIRNIISVNPEDNNRYNNQDLISYTSTINSDTLRRYNSEDNQTISTTLFVTYRYPLTKKLTGVVTLSGDYNLNARKSSIFDKDLLTDMYSIFLDSQSTNLERSQFIEKAKAGITYKFNKKISLDFNLENQWMQIKNDFNRLNINNLYQNYYNLLPTSRLVLGAFSINYSASLRQPNVYNLQPVTIQPTKLYSFTGNPYLKPTKSDRLDLSFNKYYPKSELSIYGNVNASTEKNTIISIRTISNEGAYTTKPENRDGSYNIGGSIGGSKGFKKMGDWKLRYSPSISIYQSRNIVFLNQNEGFQNNLSFYIRQGFTINWKDLVDLSPSYNISPRITSYDITGFKTVKYTSHNFDTRYNIKFPKRIFIEGNYNYRYNPLASAGYRKSSYLLNASVAKQMFKGDKGEIKISCYDILDQNIDTYRYASENAITDVQSNILKRYFLLTYTFKFNKTVTQ